MFLQKDNINDAKIALDDGKIVGIPTETVYGLAGNAYSNKSIKKIYKLKKRKNYANQILVFIPSQISILS